MQELNKKQLFKLRMETARMFPYNNARLCLVIPIRQHVNNEGIVTLGRDFIGLSDEFNEASYSEMKDVLAHSVLYYQLNHYKRSKSFVTDKISKLIWNFASEICRSSFLHRYVKTCYKDEQKPALEINGVQFARPEDFDLPDGLSVEQYYELLYAKYMENKNALESLNEGTQIDYDNNEENEYSGTGNYGDQENTGDMAELTSASEPGEGTSADGNEVEASLGADKNNASDIMNFDVESQIQIESMQAIKNALSALSRGFNSMCGELQYFSESPEARDRRKIERLRKLLHTCIYGGPGRHVNGPRPRKRGLSDIKIMQEIKMGYKPIAVIVDVSGSTESFRDKIYDVLALTIRATSLIDVYIGDVTVLQKKRGVKRPNQINSLPSGGGTDMAAIMKELDKAGKYHTIIVVTDGLTPWPESPLRAKTFVCLLGDAFGAEADVPSWIKLI